MEGYVPVALSLKPTNGNRTFGKDPQWNTNISHVHGSRFKGQVRIYYGDAETDPSSTKAKYLNEDCIFKDAAEHLTKYGITSESYPLVLVEDTITRDCWYILKSGRDWLTEQKDYSSQSENKRKKQKVTDE
jgi:hypothetical protein